MVAEIPDLFGPGMTAQMAYYETKGGAKVFAAGAFYFTRLAHVDPTHVWHSRQPVGATLTPMSIVRIATSIAT